MKKIAIYGAGGLGREMGLLIAQINEHFLEWDLIGYFDDHIDAETRVKNLKVIGGIMELNKFNEELNLIVAIADSNVRSTIIDSVNNSKIVYPSLIHPSTIMEDKEVDLGEGSVITAGNILTTDIKVGDHCIINLGCTIGHDVELGDYCSVMPGVHLSGNVKVSSHVLIGTGARILQNLTIADYATIGAGAVVTKGILEGETVVGVPARNISKDA